MQAMKFNGSGSEYFKIWIVNLLLTIVTLTLYYPWAKVRNKRYFYGNTTLAEQNFEYHATGKQLFVGYLVSLGALLVYILLQQVSPTGGALVFLILIIALPWIIFRSLIFNMRVSSYSNVRFGFEGSLGGAYFNYMLLPVLVFLAIYGLPVLSIVILSSLGFEASSLGFVITIAFLLGLILAVYAYGNLKKHNNTYVIGGSRFGQGKFITQLESGPFVKILLKTIGLSFLAMFLLLILIAVLSAITGFSSDIFSIGAALENPEAMDGIFENGGGLFLGLIGSIYLWFIFVGVATLAYMQARQRKYILANTTLDGKVALASTVGARGLAWISVSNLLIIIFTLGLGSPWAHVRMAKYMAAHTEVDTSEGFDEYVTQQLNEQSALGDQLGDAFDVDVGIGI